ncbi:jg21861 [Pararge aegeria aegeria]|uniref:Jg21861 protein n=1 Tax=Pararge aegeria aegeria TaxID=348720 RepID=A0A8S4QRW8_9NEOP|nr:jg21861 [Pararge aegeria aegeria]
MNGSVTNQADLECYMFYDINTRLCAALGHSELDLQADYNSKMQKSQNVAALCAGAKDWKFATIHPNPALSVLVKVFSDPVNCQKLCGVGELLSQDANYYCKYFKWGTEVIHILAPAQTLPIQEINKISAAGAPVLSHGKNDATAPSINTNNVSVSSTNIEVNSDNTKLTKPVESKKEDSLEKSVQEQQEVPTSTANQTSGLEKTSAISNGGKIIKPSTVPVRVSSVKNELEHPAVEEEPPKKDEVEKNGVPLEDPKDLTDVKGKLDDINPEDDENDNDDYDQHDETVDKINKNDNGGVESDPDVVFKSNNNPSLKIESITFPPQKVPDMYQNGIPDSYTDDEDHFFPIFLTGIILVVLLYILYHNKSKFTKVILGLLVEGRQSSRRRNSRGHAYRRLDTLEQAMSSNTAAPPSKIIY